MSTGEVQLRTTTQCGLRAGPRLRETAPANVSRIGILFLMSCVLVSACEHGKTQSVSSPTGVVQTMIHTSKDGKIRYFVIHDGLQFVLDWKLGIKMGDTSFVEDLKLQSVTNPRLISVDHSMMIGRREDITYEQSERIFPFVRSDQGEWIKPRGLGGSS